jgi:DNA-binding transcriptional MerR regulator
MLDLKGGANPMNQVQTVSTVSKSLGISSRMLRYYEQIGLIESQRIEDYAYRVYDENAIGRLRQIIILRKLDYYS